MIGHNTQSILFWICSVFILNLSGDKTSHVMSQLEEKTIFWFLYLIVVIHALLMHVARDNMYTAVQLNTFSMGNTI